MKVDTEGMWPTPAQWLATVRGILDTGTDGQRTQLAEQNLANAQKARDCWRDDHAGLVAIEEARASMPHTEHSFKMVRDEDADFLRVEQCPCGQYLQSRALLDGLALTLPAFEELGDVTSLTVTTPAAPTTTGGTA